MKLSDVMSNLGLAAYPIVGLIIFLTIFVTVVLSVYGRRRREDFDHAAAMPLSDDSFEPSKQRSHATEALQ